MHHFSQFIAVSSFIGMMSLGTVQAANTATVNCPSQKISTAVASATPGVPYTITVNGSCVENVDIPKYDYVTINGNTGSSLQPTAANNSAISVAGFLTINNLTITSPYTLTNGNALVMAYWAGYAIIQNSSISSTTADVLVGAFSNSTIQMVNTPITGGKLQAFVVNVGSLGKITANGTQNITISSNSTSGEAIGCYQSGLNITANDTAVITIGPGPQGISARGCTASVGAATNGPTGTIKFSGNSSAAIRAKAGDSINLRNVTIQGNDGYAVDVSAGVVEIDKSTVNVSGQPLFARRDGVVYFNNIYGSSTISGSSNFYKCYQGGHIYADSGALINGSNNSNATSTNCLTIGGSPTN